MDPEIWLRSKLRKFGITRYLHPERAIRSLYYRGCYAATRPSEIEIGFADCRARLPVRGPTEFAALMSKKEDARFMRLLAEHLQNTSCFWDVGSNIGYYALLAAKLVPDGEVIAFEPEPNSRTRLRENISRNAISNIRVVECALARVPGEFEFESAAEATAGVHRLAVADGDRLASGQRIRVQVETGDRLAAKTLPRPHVVKIDVEGAELDVIEGMQEILRSPSCRLVFCEVHFGLLEARGTPTAPRQIEACLRGYGLRQQRWVDSSHLLAVRAS